MMNITKMSVLDALFAGYIQLTDLGVWHITNRAYHAELRLGLRYGPLEKCDMDEKTI